MVPFAKLLPPALSAFIFITTTCATSISRRATHRTHYIGAERSVEFETFHPESTFEAYGVGGVDPFPAYRRFPRSTTDPGDSAASFLASKLGISQDNIEVRTIAQGQVAQYVFLSQKLNGIPFANAVANVAFNNNGNVSSYSTSFVELSGSAAVTPSVTLDEATATAEKALAGAYNGHPTSVEFVVQPNGFAALTYSIQIENDTAATWYEAFVDAHNNTLVSVVDFVVNASYLALPINERNPTQGFQTITDPQIKAASPNGWHQEFSTVSNLTAGNNAIAYTGDQLINITVQTSATLNFDYVVDLTQDPTAGTNTPGAVVNAFYVTNLFHDYSYLYGFTESTFNFQTNNFNNGGQGFDRVLVDVHEPNSTTDGAVFAIPPDGQSPKLLLYLFAGFSPKRDSALQNDILVHESQHGATNRMTGGGTAACFQSVQAQGVDEGYADAMADFVTQNGTTVDYVFGQYVGNGSTGLRNYVYSTSNVTNTLRYSSLGTLTNVYDMGSVWANVLHNVYAELVNTFGWSSTALTDTTTNKGNVVWLHLLFDALLLQPCNPTFIQARDAWIQADANRYKGVHTCVLWQTFASRGFGVNATGFIDDTSFPPECNC